MDAHAHQPGQVSLGLHGRAGTCTRTHARALWLWGNDDAAVGVAGDVGARASGARDGWRDTRNEYKSGAAGKRRLQLHCLHLSRVRVHARGVEKCQTGSSSSS